MMNNTNKNPPSFESGFLFGVIVQNCNLLKSKKEDLRSKSPILFHYSLLPLTQNSVNANLVKSEE